MVAKGPPPGRVPVISCFPFIDGERAAQFGWRVSGCDVGREKALVL